jgi:hypothetical protein
MTLKRAFLIILGSFVWLIGFALLDGALSDPHHSGPLDLFMPIALVGFSLLFLAGFAV